MTRFTIPANFMAESTMFHGRINVRRAIEGVIAALPFLLIAFGVHTDSIQQKITVIVFSCAIPFAIGLAGFNGDPWSVVIKNASNWNKNKSVMLYDTKVKPLKETPLDVLMRRDTMKDRILDKLDELKAQRRERRDDKVYIEGVTFEFAEDNTYDYVTEADIEKVRRKNRRKQAGIEGIHNGVIVADTSASQAITDELNRAAMQAALEQEMFARIMEATKSSGKQAVPVKVKKDVSARAQVDLDSEELI